MPDGMMEFREDGSGVRITRKDSQADEVEIGISSDGSFYFTPREVVVHIAPSDADLETGSNKAWHPFTAGFAGFELTAVKAYHRFPAGTSGVTTVTIDRIRGAATDAVLSTALTIDGGDAHSGDAATAAVIDTSFDDIQEDDIYEFDITTLPSGGIPQGLAVVLTLTKP